MAVEFQMQLMAMRAHPLLQGLLSSPANMTAAEKTTDDENDEHIQTKSNLHIVLQRFHLRIFLRTFKLAYNLQ